MDFPSADARRRYEELLSVARSTIVGLDFDGTLSPIVEDPASAHIHPGAPDVLLEVAGVVRALAVVTGRPARQAVALGGLDEIGATLAERGHALHVFGQYGHEQWSSEQPRVRSPRPPHGLATFLRELPGNLRRADAPDAYVEDKGLAVAVHTRRLADPAAAFDRLMPVLAGAAERVGLIVEPGRNVIEVRPPGTHKGDVVEQLARDLDAGGFVFIGDDLGDVDAFQAVLGLRDRGLPTLLVCSASEEESALLPMSDLAVPGPDGVLEFLRMLARDAAAVRG